MFVTSYDVIELIGGPFNGQLLIRDTNAPQCDAHCEDVDGFVHVYGDLAGSTLFYSDAYQMVRFPRPTRGALPPLPKDGLGSSSWFIGSF